MLPEGWNQRKLDDVAELIGGSTPSKAVSDYWDGEIPWATPSDITSLSASANYIYNTSSKITKLALEETSVRLLNPGSVLMTSRATIGEVVINMVPMATNQGFCNFIPNSSINAEYLTNWLKFSKKELKRLAAGSTFLEISKKTLKNIEIDLPPLSEQIKIAAILSSVDDAIQATQAVIEQSGRVKQGLLQQLLTRGIGHTRFKQTEIGEIPYGWEICDLAQVANVIDCKHRTPKYTDQGYPVIRPRDVKEGILEFSGCLRIPQDEYEDLIENHCPLSGDVVYSRNATFGIASIVDTDRPFAIGQDVCIITGIHMCGEILFYLLNSRVVRKQLDSLSAGSTFKRINLKDIRRFKVPLIPKAEQGEIVAIADSLSEYLRATNLELDQLIQTKRGLMQDLLTGRVRVNCAE